MKFDEIYNKIISEMNEDIMRQVGFGQSVDDVHNGLCPSCHQHVDSSAFRDEVSKREFGISGLCQKCQDEIFGSNTEDTDFQDDDVDNCDLEDEDLQDDDFQDDDFTEFDETEAADVEAVPEEPEDFRDDEYVNSGEDF